MDSQLNAAMLAICLLALSRFLVPIVANLSLTPEMGLNLMLSLSIVLFMVVAVKVINQTDADK